MKKLLPMAESRSECRTEVESLGVGQGECAHSERPKVLKEGKESCLND